MGLMDAATSSLRLELHADADEPTVLLTPTSSRPGIDVVVALNVHLRAQRVTPFEPGRLGPDWSRRNLRRRDGCAAS